MAGFAHLTPDQIRSKNQKAGETRRTRNAGKLLAQWAKDLGPFTDRDFRLIAKVSQAAYNRGFNAQYAKRRS